MKAVDYTALQVWSLIWNGRHLGIEYLLSRHSLELSLQFLQKTPNPGDPKAFIQWFILKSLVLSLQPTVVHKSHSVLTHNLLKKWKKGRFRAKSFIFLVLVFSSSRDRIGGNGLKLPQGCLDWIWGKNGSLKVLSSIRMGCPMEWLSHHPRRHLNMQMWHLWTC